MKRIAKRITERITKRTIIGMLIMALALSMLTFTASATTTVKVQIAPYTTDIEHIGVYNGAVEYPLLVYKNITYLPLTAGVCERLGLASGFDSEKGLYITKAQLSYSFEDAEAFGGSALNYYGTEYEAQIPEYPIYLNGISINSHKEEYPFLNFRGITYMPLTYKFAVEELNLFLDWSQENQHFRLYKSENWFTEKMTDIYAYVELGKITDGYASLMKTTHGYTEYTDELGQPKRYPYHWYDVYRLETENDTLSHLGTTYEFNNDLYERRELMPYETTDKVKLDEHGVLTYDGTELTRFVPTETGIRALSVYGREFEIGNKTLIFVGMNFGTAPAPYTSINEFLFLKNENGIEMLKNYDVLCMLNNVYPDENGGAYICTHGYRPMASSRWSNPHSSVYYLDPDGTLSDLTESYPDINSIRAIGYHGGKLYVEAMYYGTQKENYTWDNRFSTVNSGYYAIDSKNGNSMTKLYPYISGEAFVTPDGGFYCIADYAKKPRIINLITRIITEVE